MTSPPRPASCPAGADPFPYPSRGGGDPRRDRRRAVIRAATAVGFVRAGVLRRSARVYGGFAGGAVLGLLAGERTLR
ncbi:hypothetical protein ACFCZ1_23755 [Streptomyces sp. NPDC056224]|uniref:hypothetical protein n=1 Tax=Streptomyces sp. NPDC056224 TaxID=3345750 RepID=UPI0035D6FD73